MNNYTPKYLRDGSDTSTEKRISRARYNRRKARQKRLVIFSCLVAVTIAITYTVILALLPKSDLEVVKGTWVYDPYTKYEFDGNGNGCMCLEDLHYKYTYDISDNELTLDFEDEAVHDCTYTFEVKDNILTMIGKEGTVGGTYELTKE